MPRITLDHLVHWFKAGVGDLCDRELLVVGLLRGYDRRVRRQREVDTRVGDQVSLELGEIHVEGPVKPEGGGDGGDHLGDETVQVDVAGVRYV